MKKEIYRHNIKSYWPTIKIGYIRWFPFLTIMEYTADKINNQIIILPQLLNFFEMYNKNLKEDVVNNIGVKFSICRKQLVYL